MARPTKGGNPLPNSRVWGQNTVHKTQSFKETSSVALNIFSSRHSPNAKHENSKLKSFPSVIFVTFFWWCISRFLTKCKWHLQLCVCIVQQYWQGSNYCFAWSDNYNILFLNKFCCGYRLVQRATYLKIKYHSTHPNHLQTGSCGGILLGRSGLPGGAHVSSLTPGE